ncbi:GNAT family N-acetyltransferase [Pedobacter arcticus]|uniref:GNAT family N-acetyltransferase n=1 Tax=Pedobacter arcticus TaxID=752140 RepID=UPI000306AE99|nr:GNAT family N-acetyltransferase [Pedobacter arcticus]
MIKFLQTADVLSLRNKILRNDKLTLEECILENDSKATTFHIGFLVENEAVCIASFHQQPKDDFTGLGYQLRGMATDEDFQGKGYGNRVMNFAIVYLRGQNANYLWCNAREKAFKFYLSLGFEFIGDKFEIPHIGTHSVMYLKIK